MIFLIILYIDVDENKINLLKKVVNEVIEMKIF